MSKFYLKINAHIISIDFKGALVVSILAHSPPSFEKISPSSQKLSCSNYTSAMYILLSGATLYMYAVGVSGLQMRYRIMVCFMKRLEKQFMNVSELDPHYFLTK